MGCGRSYPDGEVVPGQGYDPTLASPLEGARSTEKVGGHSVSAYPLGAWPWATAHSPTGYKRHMQAPQEAAAGRGHPYLPRYTQEVSWRSLRSHREQPPLPGGRFPLRYVKAEVQQRLRTAVARVVTHSPLRDPAGDLGCQRFELS